MKKLKILMLSTTDFKMAGHMIDAFNKLPNEYYDKRKVVLETLAAPEAYGFYYQKSLSYRIRKKIYWLIWQLKNFFKYGEFVISNKLKSEYCYYSINTSSITAKQILDKCDNFKPDVISLHWVSNFISPKIIKDLYDLTHAHILLVFVDEQFLSGGCNYHIDCKGYLTGCKNCPALKTGKKIAEDLYSDKTKYLQDLPITLFAVKDNIEKAHKTPYFKNKGYIESISCPIVKRTPTSIARKKFNIDDKRFVVLIAATYLHEKRKGIIYSLKALNYWNIEKKDITIVLLGKTNIDTSLLEGYNIIQPGFLEYEEMIELFCACNVFLSTTIGDSGPYMVNYAFALGVPVISFDLGIAHTLIKHKETGYLASYCDYKSVAEGLNYIYNLDKEERNKMSQKEIETINAYSAKEKWYEMLYNRWINNELN